MRHVHVPRRDRHARLPHLRQPPAAPRPRRGHPLTQRDASRRPVARRDADGGYRIGPTWESITERLIREAQEAGDFDGLPGRGHRLEFDDDPREGEMGLAFHILRTNRAVPPWIAADRDARRCAEAVEALIVAAAGTGRSGRVGPATRTRLRTRLERALDEHTRAVDALNAGAPSVTLQRMHIDRSAVMARLERALDGDAGALPPT